MQFLRSNAGLIGKTIGFQIVISLLGMMLGTATGAYSALRLVGAVCAVLCYFYIVGTHFWNQGAEDAVRRNPSPLKGLLAALIAYLPSILCVLLCCFLPMTDGAGAENWVFALFAVTKLVFMGVYFGFAAVLYPTNLQSTPAEVLAASHSQSVFFAFCLIPAILVAAVTYILGCKGIDPFGIFSEGKKK